jgi:hypothetical protein
MRFTMEWAHLISKQLGMVYPATRHAFPKHLGQKGL